MGEGFLNGDVSAAGYQSYRATRGPVSVSFLSQALHGHVESA